MMKSDLNHLAKCIAMVRTTWKGAGEGLCFVYILTAWLFAFDLEDGLPLLCKY